MLKDADLANKRAFEKRIADQINLLHDLGGTRRGSQRFASPELSYAAKALRESAHWLRDHYFTNIQGGFQPRRNNGEAPKESEA